MAGKHHDLIDFTAKYKSAVHEFFLDLNSWRKFKTRYKLSWHKLPFSEASKADIPEVRGIYAFTVELTDCKLPPHGYILYMGITGNSSDANLKKRFSQYLLHLKNEDGRPAVYIMLKKWQRDLQFNFVPLPSKSIDLAKIERAFLGALIPPVNKKDLGADITAVKAADF